ncbi:hypothetical protein EV2_011845 [Malus domestica]
MSGLLLMKALNLICAADDKHYVKGKKKFVKQMTHGSKSHRALGSIGAGTDAIPTTSPELLAARQTFSPTPALPRHLPPSSIFVLPPPSDRWLSQDTTPCRA